MRIAHVQGIFSPEHGGPAHSLANYCVGQSRRGHHVSAWVLEGLPHTSPAIRLPLPIETNICRVGFPAALGRSIVMRKGLRVAPRPDIVHLHGTWLRAMYYGAVEAKRRDAPYLIEMMGMYEPYGLQQKWARKRFARLWFQDAIVRDAACLHVNSESEGKQLRRLGFDAPLAVLPVGVDTDHIGERRASVSPSAPWPQVDHRPFVLYLARVHPKKGVEILLEAWARVAPLRSDFLLVVAGTGTSDYLAHCKGLAERLGVAASVLWVGQISDDEKWLAYANAELYVLPTFSENFGNSVAEALACGTPVLTTIGTPWQILADSGCGWVIRPEAATLAETLQQALSLSSSQRRAMGAAGRKLVEERFSLRAVITQLEEVYRWLIRSGPVPSCVIQD